MRAMVLDEWGGPEKFVLRDIEKPSVKPGHVLIRVEATSVNPIDYKIRSGGIGFAPKLPAVLHGDVAGIVAELGEGVDHLEEGDAVYACAGGFRGLGGALAEFMLADARVVARKPEDLTFREAAAVPLVSITAWLAVVDRARVSPHDYVLVHAGAGGVGHAGIQIAKNIGAHVATTVSTAEKADVASELGADEVIYYRHESVDDYVQRLTGGRGFDVVFDTVGGETLQKSLQAVRIGGRVAGIAMRTTGSFAPVHEKDLTLSGVFMAAPLLTGNAPAMAHQRHILETLGRWNLANRFRPVVDHRHFALEDVGQAHTALESGGVLGKAVIEIGDHAEERS